jgi:hypothetical protein
MTRKTVLAALAPLFNDLMGISDGFFGSSPRQREPGDGVKRAAARLAAKREANKLIPDAARDPRQVRREAAKAARKADMKRPQRPEGA